MIKDVLKRNWYSIFKVSPYVFFAHFVPVEYLPKKYLYKFIDNFFYTQERGFLVNIIKAAIERYYYLLNEEEIRKANRKLFWGAVAGKKYHNFKRERYSNPEVFKEEFLKFKVLLLSELAKLIERNNSFKTICEIGTGNGLFLEYMSRHLPKVKEFIGIDLNEQQIEENKQVYKNTPLKFIHSEITDFVKSQSKEGTVFVTSGVFEYFTGKELEELFNLIRNKLNTAAIALNEPVNLDLNTEFVSKPRDNLSFSHNYSFLFKKCNYHIFSKRIDPIDTAIPFYDSVIMVATTLPIDLIERESELRIK